MESGNVLRQTWTLMIRELKHWYRVKIQIFMALIQPIVWLGLFGQAFQLNKLIPAGDQIPGSLPPFNFSLMFAGAPDYFSYMAAGMLAVIVLFTCMFGGMSIVWDRRFGFLDKLRASPIPRGVIPVSRIGATVIRAMIQMLIVFVIALLFTYVPGLTGLTLNPGFNALDFVGLFLAMLLLAIAFASLFTTIALAVENQETLFGVINLLNLPIMFASAALFPTTLMPDWLKAVANYNPLTLAVDAARIFIFHNPNPIYNLWIDLGGLALFAFTLLAISVILSRKLMGAK
ncbi:MAG: ABC transporter permease [Methanomassiliicoccales archaeon]|jgi:ABC-2 type transport system permease protein|nr:ABC transporter permease [Methanomassiliicoccales archaeon]